MRRTGLINNIEYSRVQGVSLQMDASIPASAGRTAAVILVHGGAWVSGDRIVDVEPLFKPLSEAGFAWFSISYRLATDLFQVGAAIDDVRAAIRYVKSHALEFNIDPDRIALIGESAGGQLAAMAALRGGPQATVRAVVAFYTPSDLVSLAKTSDHVPAAIRNAARGAPRENPILDGIAQISPIDHVRPNMPPFLFIHGTADSLVPFQQSRDMCERMKKVGASCEIYPLEGADHGLRLWESLPKLAADYKREMIRWLRDKLETVETLAS